MNQHNIQVDVSSIPVHSANTLIIGSGAAALNAAIQLRIRGIEDILIVTTQLGSGTSHNAGSDKQTYYKLAIDGIQSDSALEMAKDLAAGGCMHGDIARCEAQHSVQAFYHLVHLGVPFPHDSLGSYPGYRTDHDQKGRASSAGPRTSRYMVEHLLQEVKRLQIKILEHHQVFSLLKRMQGQRTEVAGALAIKTDGDQNDRYDLVLFNAVNVILATGGPGGMYRYSVYPEEQTGATGMALRIGALAQNLTESQFGISSLNPRWNVSGSYQQVIPKYISTHQDGSEEKEFLIPYFNEPADLYRATFRKGYQWPFDPRKVGHAGSSLIDLLVYQETVLRNRRVFLDFRSNPSGLDPGQPLKDQLSDEIVSYLEKSDALREDPFTRLAHMNQPAIDLYQEKGVDLAVEPLEIGVCAQHNNGGLTGDIWWESNIKHLFPIGEVNGSHGVYRPGGSALNAGQVGGIRAALRITSSYTAPPPDDLAFRHSIMDQVIDQITMLNGWMKGSTGSAETLLSEMRARMSSAGAHIRNKQTCQLAFDEAMMQNQAIRDLISVNSTKELPDALSLYDQILTHTFYLKAILDFIERGGGSRGSYLVQDPDGIKAHEKLDDAWRYRLQDPEHFTSRHIQEIGLNSDGHIMTKWVSVRSVPDQTGWFEEVWKAFRESRNHL